MEFLSKCMLGLSILRFRARATVLRVFRPIWFRKIGSNCWFSDWPTIIFAFRDIQLGQRCMVGPGVSFCCGPHAFIRLGNDIGLNQGCFIAANYGITIGHNTRIGEYVSIRDCDHVFDDPGLSISEQGLDGGVITIGRDVWIGRGVYIGKNVTIGDGAVIGANAVVVRDVPSFGIAVGVPAKVIGMRGKERQTMPTNN